MKKTALVLFIVLSVFATFGCGQKPSATHDNEANFCSVTDSAKRTVTLPKKPERIVVVSASFLEPLYAVDGEVVGRPSSKTKLPEKAAAAADIGPVYQIDTEKLLACRPDLVVINKGMNERLLDLLTTNNIPAAVIEMKGYDDVKKELAIFGAFTGHPEKAAAIAADMDAQIKTIADKMPKEPKRVAVLHSTAQGLSVQLDGSIAGNILKLLGQTNVAADMPALDGKPDTAPYSLETLIEQNPEIIFVTSMGNIDDIKRNMEKTIAENPAWQTIPAVQNNRLYYLPQDMFLLSPGIHYPEAVQMVSKLLYPAEFPDE